MPKPGRFSGRSPEGDLASTERVEVASTGRLEGNVTTQTLVGNEGAIVTGYCSSGPDYSPKPG
ncbi:MAG: polymer-forming cytoskeletal protein [Bacillota bacterium]